MVKGWKGLVVSDEMVEEKEDDNCISLSRHE